MMWSATKEGPMQKRVRCTLANCAAPANPICSAVTERREIARRSWRLRLSSIVTT